MKKIKFLILFLAVAVVGVSCETYDDYDTNRLPAVGFTAKNKNINSIPQGGQKSTTIDVFASDVSDSDRTFDVITVPIEDTVTNPPTTEENYEFDRTVTIPANSRVGTMTVTGIGNTLPSGERVYFKLAIDSDPSVVAGGQILIALRGS
jgi:hypothetical protein